MLVIDLPKAGQCVPQHDCRNVLLGEHKDVHSGTASSFVFTVCF